MKVLSTSTVLDSSWGGSLAEMLGQNGEFAEPGTFLYIVKCFCLVGKYALNGEDTSEALTVVVDGVRDTAVVDGLVAFLQDPQTVRRPRVIFMSSIETWAGSKKSGSLEITDSSSRTFYSRLPVTGEYALYGQENKIASLMLQEKLPGLEVCIVSVGLLYGGSGGDMELIFQDMWRYNPETSGPIKLKSLLGGKNKVPMIHYKELSSMVNQLAQAESDSLPLFISASDGCDKCLEELFQEVFWELNGKPEQPAPPAAAGKFRRGS